MKKAIDIADVSAEWLTAMLGYEIRSIDVQKIGTGQMGTACRIGLDADQGAKTVVVKCAAGEPDARQRVSGGYRREVGFYSELADRVDS